jgi:hypothetical protein
MYIYVPVDTPAKRVYELREEGYIVMFEYPLNLISKQHKEKV